jgi:hypothetical protein
LESFGCVDVDFFRSWSNQTEKKPLIAVKTNGPNWFATVFEKSNTGTSMDEDDSLKCKFGVRVMEINWHLMNDVVAMLTRGDATHDGVFKTHILEPRASTTSLAALKVLMDKWAPTYKISTAPGKTYLKGFKEIGQKNTLAGIVCFKTTQLLNDKNLHKFWWHPCFPHPLKSIFRSLITYFEGFEFVIEWQYPCHMVYHKAQGTKSTRGKSESEWQAWALHVEQTPSQEAQSSTAPMTQCQIVVKEIIEVLHVAEVPGSYPASWSVRFEGNNDAVYAVDPFFTTESGQHLSDTDAQSVLNQFGHKKNSMTPGQADVVATWSQDFRTYIDAILGLTRFIDIDQCIEDCEDVLDDTWHLQQRQYLWLVRKVNVDVKGADLMAVAEKAALKGTKLRTLSGLKEFDDSRFLNLQSSGEDDEDQAQDISDLYLDEMPEEEENLNETEHLQFFSTEHTSEELITIRLGKADEILQSQGMTVSDLNAGHYCLGSPDTSAGPTNPAHGFPPINKSPMNAGIPKWEDIYVTQTNLVTKQDETKLFDNCDQSDLQKLKRLLEFEQPDFHKSIVLSADNQWTKHGLPEWFDFQNVYANQR